MSGSENGGRTRSIEALRESEELHRATLAAISDAVFLTDDQGAFTYICPNVDVIFGHMPDEVQAMGRISSLLGDNLFDLDELSARGEIPNIEREVTAKSGERHTVLILVKRVSIKGGTVLYSCRDVTELRAVEKELAAARLTLSHAARLSLVGQLVGSIVHDVYQPLTSIQLSARAGLNTLADPADSGKVQQARQIFQNIHKAAALANEILVRLRKLMRKSPLEMQAIDVNAMAWDVLSLVRTDMERRGVMLRAELEPSLPAIVGDRISLQQIVLQLLTNAIEAMDGAKGERVLGVTTRLAPGGVEIDVADTGPGVPVEHRQRLFDEFFTTKPDGVGLGLSIARAIAVAHGGDIALDPDRGPGASFRVTLPLSEGQAQH